MQRLGHAPLDPLDPLPFARGWMSTARAAWRLLQPVWFTASVPFLGVFSILVVADNVLGPRVGDDVMVVARSAFVGFAGTIAFALATALLFARFVVGETSLRRAMALVMSRGRVVVALGLATGGMWTFASAAGPYLLTLLFLVLGPPFVVHSVLLERCTTGDAVARTRSRLHGRALDAVGVAFALEVVLLFVRGELVRILTWLLPDGLHFPADAAWTAVSGLVLAYATAAWMVAFLNARALSEGVDSRRLAREWPVGTKGPLPC